MSDSSGHEDDATDASVTATGWDQGRAPAGTPSYDYEGLLHYDLLLRWTLYAAAIPPLVPLAEWAVVSNRFDASLKILAVCAALSSIALLLGKYTAHLTLTLPYTLYFLLQYRLFYAP
ncbi:MAG TPA: hypothetical protein VL860_00680, partial [Planctomycetota bacterium]|nr:hypothetical protein [Planctomycetota bacterium]